MNPLQIDEVDPKVCRSHVAKLAYVYVRQSSVGQVSRHQESTDVQYRLAERAVRLGWSESQVKIIDEDLGKSGSSSIGRSGFQHLIGEIGLGRVGLVVSFDASRLARNNYDWYRLLELCGIFGSLIADSERVYDPNLFTDRMLLGLTGMMSEAELHQIKRRMRAGALNKARRAELHLPIPVGLARLPDGQVILNPDEEVRARIRLIFEKFTELGTARKVRNYLLQNHLLLPSRPLRGPAPHETFWEPARSSVVLAVLRNPAYAGAYVYGCHTRDPTRHSPEHPYSGVVTRPIDQWPITVHNMYPAYISWEQYLANRRQLTNNRFDHRRNFPGAPRKGKALLQGIVRCARCAALMNLGYSGPHGEYPVYRCEHANSEYGGPRCQEVRGLGLDREVERLFLQALQPDQIELALAALQELETEYAALTRQRELHLQRLEYEAQRARRQYEAVEPENRLVARTLETSWEEKLRELQKATEEHTRWLKGQRLELTGEDREDILKLGHDLAGVWNADSTTDAERKQMLRLIIEHVIVDQKRESGKVWLKIAWRTGAVSEHWYNRNVRSLSEHEFCEGITACIRELHSHGKLDDEIACELNRRGFHGAKGAAFTSKTVWILRTRLGLPSVNPNGPLPNQGEDGTYSVAGAAEAVGVYPGTIYTWLKSGRIHGEQPRKGTIWRIHLTPPDIAELQKHLARARRSRREAQ
jgi:DNA invertase Pin-like site-specific DNA recombinase